MTDFTLNAQARTDLGKGASRRLRHALNIPAVVYGGNKPAESVTILAKEIAKLFENEAAYSHVIELNVDGTKQNVIVKAMQRHPAANAHADRVRWFGERNFEPRGAGEFGGRTPRRGIVARVEHVGCAGGLGGGVGSGGAVLGTGFGGRGPLAVGVGVDGGVE